DALPILRLHSRAAIRPGVTAHRVMRSPARNAFRRLQSDFQLPWCNQYKLNQSGLALPATGREAAPAPARDLENRRAGGHHAGLRSAKSEADAALSWLQ